jgi:hypothetical protein
MCDRTNNPATPLPLSLMAVADLRDALTALEHSQPATALAALMAIEPQAWPAIAQRLRTVLHPAA